MKSLSTWYARTLTGAPVVSTDINSARLYVGQPHVTGARGAEKDSDGVQTFPVGLATKGTAEICMQRPGKTPTTVTYALNVFTTCSVHPGTLTAILVYGLYSATLI